ncbi:MAG: putative prokaryotic signal transducing protein [Actinomycetota bacterium]|jgi:hypothetical protein|nr:putative prokaryotic signal transducing protein [Actinomycetota bacterium]
MSMVVGSPPTELLDDDRGGGGSAWVTLVRAANDIDAHLLAGRLTQEGIEYRFVKDRSDPGAWLYGGSNPWAPVTVMVKKIQFEDARIVLAEASMEAPAVEPVRPAEQRRRPLSYSLVWWALALALGALFTGMALTQTARQIEPCHAANCSQPGPQP